MTFDAAEPAAFNTPPVCDPGFTATAKAASISAATATEPISLTFTDCISRGRCVNRGGGFRRRLTETWRDGFVQFRLLLARRIAQVDQAVDYIFEAHVSTPCRSFCSVKLRNSRALRRRRAAS